ncbi:hypothetical protein LguiA_023706 [Lonicera macranthoides]
MAESYERKKSGGGEVEDFSHFYPSSSYFEKADVSGGGGESVSARDRSRIPVLDS